MALNRLLERDPLAFPVLECLEIKHNPEDGHPTSAVLRWPQSLTRLLLMGCGPSRAWPLDLASLPPKLTDLFGYFHSIWEPPPTTTASSSAGSSPARFPESLVALSLCLDVFIDIIPLLPVGLTSLRYIMVGPNKEHTKERDDWLETMSPLPPGLETLYLPFGQYSRTSLQRLPRSLTNLLHQGHCVDPMNFDVLPPLLRSSVGLLPRMILKSLAPIIPKHVERISGEVAADAVPHLGCKNSIRILDVGQESILGMVQEMASLQLIQLDTTADAESPQALDTISRAFPDGSCPGRFG